MLPRHCRLSLILVSGLILLGGAPSAWAQQAIVAASRSIDWRAVGIPGGIPRRTTVCATLNPGASGAEISSAILACPSGQVVQLSAGTYHLTEGVTFYNKSNVTLRGAGPDQTFLVFESGASVSCFGQFANVCLQNGELNWTLQPSNSADWTAGYAKGTTQITLSNTTGLTVGHFIILDQENDSDVDPGGIWVCEKAGVCSDEGPGLGARLGRAQQQFVRVVAIAGNDVTISPGLYMPNWRSSQNPQAWWPNTVIKSSGIEDLSLDHTASDESAGIVMMNAYNCWVKDVRSLNSNRSHVRLYQTSASVIRDSYFYGTKNAASQSYGIEGYQGSDNLIENNIFQHVTAPLMNNAASSGYVWAYIFSVDDYYTVSPGWMMGQAWLHAGGIDDVLFEGNDGAGLTSDAIHGTHHFVTAFRNYWLGWEPAKDQQTTPVNVYAFSRYLNLIGNVLGKTGYHTNYEQDFPSGTDISDVSVFVLGKDALNTPADAAVKTTVLRWGNYDVVTGAARFDAGEVPSGLSRYRQSRARQPDVAAVVLPVRQAHVVGREAVAAHRPGCDGRRARGRRGL